MSNLAKRNTGFGRRPAAALAVLIGLGLAGDCRAASGTQLASDFTAPAGLIQAGSHLWVADAVFGFCRLDTAPAGGLFVNLSTCVKPPNGIVGQPAYDAVSGIVYVPDSQPASQGVWRYQFDAASETFGGGMLVAETAGLGGQRPRCVALGPDGNLYVTGAVNGNVIRIVSPAANSFAQFFATTASRRPALGLQFLDVQLLLAETAGVTMIPDPTTCGLRCPNAVNLGLAVSAPTALAVDPVARLLYIGTPLGVFRWTRSTGQVNLFSNTGTSLGATVPYSNITGLGVDPAGNLFIADDPAAGQVAGKASLYEVPSGSPIVGVGPTPTPPGLLPPFINVTPIANPALFDAAGLTTPTGATWIGNHLWVSDGLAGFCRVDPVAGILDPTSCAVPGFAIVGQAAFDPATASVYLPATTPGAGANLVLRGGIGRLGYDAATDTVSNVPLPVVSTTDLGDAPTCAAMGPDGNLYVGFLRSSKIVRITNPTGTTHALELVGTLSDPTTNAWNLTFAGNDLWIAEKVMVSVMKNVTSCSGACKAEILPVFLTTPRAVAWDGAYLYIGSLGSVWRYNPAANTLVAVADQGPANGAPVSFGTASGLTLDNAGHLYVAEGPFLGTFPVFTRGRPVLPPGMVWFLGHAWTVSVAPPKLSAVTPAAATAGATVNVTLSGSNFATGTRVQAGAGITVSNVTVASASQMTATLVIAGNAAPGPRSISVTTPLGSSNAMTFTVHGALVPPRPAITSIAPASGRVNSTRGVKIVGTNLTSATVTVVGAAGITVTNVKLANPTEIDANFVIAAGAALGPRRVIVTTPGGASNAVSFTVN